MVIPSKKQLAFSATDTYKSDTFYDNGFIKSIVLVVPAFATATKVSQLDVIDDDSYTIYTSSTGWNNETTTLISSLSIPVSAGYTIKATLDDAAGTGGGTVVIKAFINTQQ